MAHIDDETVSKTAIAISNGFKSLLSTKHLYQSVDLDLAFLNDVAERIHQKSVLERSRPQFGIVEPLPKKETILADQTSYVMEPWEPEIPWAGGPPPKPPPKSVLVAFKLPTINAYCHKCKDGWPWNPVFDEIFTIHSERNSRRESFLLSYRCQNCKQGVIRFLIGRKRTKLTLCGRDPIETVIVPKVLPQVPGKFFGDAHIAHNSGQTLAGLFLLRTFIEQFWHSLPEVQAALKHDPRMTGEQKGEIYQKLLPDDFPKGRVPSLSGIYGDLSAVIHEADADVDAFDQASQRIIKHFEAKRVFDDNPTPPLTATDPGLLI